MYLDLDPSAAVADRAQLLQAACRNRLAALATYCQPTALARRARKLLTWARAGQLGDGYTNLDHPQPAPCRLSARRSVLAARSGCC
ncbi:MAG: hypothetical protein NVS3B1_16170 [Marmoricola sp.]